jgi:carbonic anhydrase
MVVNLARAESREAEWGYHGDLGPGHWHQLSKYYSKCRSGQEQSPIDLAALGRVTLVPLPSLAGRTPIIKISHNEHAEDITDNGHTIQVTFDRGNFLLLDGDKYELRQLHFHSPSEHVVTGRHFPLELHVLLES